MADKEKQPIIIKRINKGHAGAHGGAWKVAFADFMTAMMCFFLVMWLMGADEATKSAVAAYFNNPSSVFRPDLASMEAVPLGDKTGQGESINRGAEGQIPEDLIERPAKPFTLDQSAEKHPGEMLTKLLDGLGQFRLETMKFSVPEDLLFEKGSDKISKEGQELLEKMGQIVRIYKGQIDLRGHGTKAYENSVQRVVAVQKKIVDAKWVDESRVKTAVEEARAGSEPTVSGGAEIEFGLSRK